MQQQPTAVPRAPNTRADFYRSFEEHETTERFLPISLHLSSPAAPKDSGASPTSAPVVLPCRARRRLPSRSPARTTPWRRPPTPNRRAYWRRSTAGPRSPCAPAGPAGSARPRATDSGTGKACQGLLVGRQSVPGVGRLERQGDDVGDLRGVLRGEIAGGEGSLPSAPAPDTLPSRLLRRAFLRFIGEVSRRAPHRRSTITDAQVSSTSGSRIWPT